MATLQDMLLTNENGPHLVADTQALVDDQISSKGITAAPLKAAYKAVKAFAPGYYQEAISAMLPGMVHQLNPYWAAFVAQGGGDFGDYLSKRGDEVSESLLSVTDARAAASDRPTIIKAYRSVRGGAAKHVTAALPAVGALVQKYAG